MTAEKKVEGADSLSDDVELKTAQSTRTVNRADCVCGEAQAVYEGAEVVNVTVEDAVENEDCVVQPDSDAHTRLMTSESTNAENCHPVWHPKRLTSQQERIEAIHNEARAMNNAEHPFCFESDHLALRNNAE